MLFVVIVTYILIFAWSIKQPEHIAMFLALVISLSPFTSRFIADWVYFGLQLCMFLVLVFQCIKEKCTPKWFLLLMIVIIVLQAINTFVCKNQSVRQLLFGMYQYVFLPSFAYLSILSMRRKGMQLGRVMVFYVVINLLIFYWRAFVDYTFFGTNIAGLDWRYIDEYKIGGRYGLFRPSNLNTPLSFAVELAVLIAVILWENWASELMPGSALRNNSLKSVLKNGRFGSIVLLLVSLPVFSLMKTRSGTMLLIFLLCTLLISLKKTKLLLRVLVIGTVVLFIFQDRIYLLTAFSPYEQTYPTRINSIKNSLSLFSQFSLSEQLLGKGVGAANSNLLSDGFIYYSENFFVAHLINGGILLFVLWLGVTMFLLFKRTTYNYYRFVIIGILLVNLLASSLSINNTWYLYWLVCFSTIISKPFNIYTTNPYRDIFSKYKISREFRSREQ
jgi:hypothetical protein